RARCLQPRRAASGASCQRSLPIALSSRAAWPRSHFAWSDMYRMWLAELGAAAWRASRLTFGKKRRTRPRLMFWTTGSPSSQPRFRMQRENWSMTSAIRLRAWSDSGLVLTAPRRKWKQAASALLLFGPGGPIRFSSAGVRRMSPFESGSGRSTPWSLMQLTYCTLAVYGSLVGWNGFGACATAAPPVVVTGRLATCEEELPPPHPTSEASVAAATPARRTRFIAPTTSRVRSFFIDSSEAEPRSSAAGAPRLRGSEARFRARQRQGLAAPPPCRPRACMRESATLVPAAGGGHARGGQTRAGSASSAGRRRALRQGRPSAAGERAGRETLRCPKGLSSLRA